MNSTVKTYRLVILISNFEIIELHVTVVLLIGFAEFEQQKQTIVYYIYTKYATVEDGV